MNTTTDTRPLVERITQKTTKFVICRAEIRGFEHDILFICSSGNGDSEIARILPTHTGQVTRRKQADAELIVDAFETAHRTRRTPSELASERQELLDMLATLLDRAETVAEGIPVDKRHAGVSPATHVAHMASHLAQHCKPARELIDRLTKTTNPTEQ